MDHICIDGKEEEITSSDGYTGKNRYANLLEFINHRERRQAAADAGIARSHVETSTVHPCYWVNQHSPHCCIDDSGTIFNNPHQTMNSFH